MDFTIQTYIKLLETLQQQGFVFKTFSDFIKIPASKAIVLRHDVDERPVNSLKISRIENELGIRATYYFRIVQISNNPSVIHEIAASEILACGKPVIINDVGDLTAYVIQGQNGYIVDAGNGEEVAAAIANAFENSDNMQEACIKSMKPYDESLINSKIVKLILGCKAAL